MRDPERLEKFYDKFKSIHKTYFPDWRFGQLCSNFFGWLMQTKGQDLFFSEDDKMIEYLDEFAKDNCPFHRNWNVGENEF